MDGEEGGGPPRLSKRFSDKDKGGVEVDYKTKAGTAWSHSYLNQKPWHPLSYPNQRRKWIAEQTDAQRRRRADEVAREFAQEQEFFRQTALISKKEKEKVEMMKAVSFMYVRPPGYNAESAKAAEIADERKKLAQENASLDPAESVDANIPKSVAMKDNLGEDKRKPRSKDVFGRVLPTEEEFEVLKNAPRLETGMPARVKPFGVEVRNVKCARCGTYGHQSGDRECPLKDAIMPNEESRLKRDDPLTAILAHSDPTESLKWELKQKPGMSPPRGGFRPDDPNQQIVADDIFDEYGGFLDGGNIPDLLTNFSSAKKSEKHTKKKSKHMRGSTESGKDSKTHRKHAPPHSDRERRGSKKRDRRRKQHHSHSSASDSSDYDQQVGRRKRGRQHSDSSTSDSPDSYRHRRRRKHRPHHYSDSSSE